MRCVALVAAARSNRQLRETSESRFPSSKRSRCASASRTGLKDLLPRKWPQCPLCSSWGNAKGTQLFYPERTQTGWTKDDRKALLESTINEVFNGEAEQPTQLFSARREEQTASGSVAHPPTTHRAALNGRPRALLVCLLVF